MAETFKEYLQKHKTKKDTELRTESIKTYTATLNPVKHLISPDDVERTIKVFNKDLARDGNGVKISTYKHYLKMIGVEDPETVLEYEPNTFKKPDTTDIKEKVLKPYELRKLYEGMTDTFYRFVLSFLYDTAMRQRTARLTTFKDITYVESDVLTESEKDKYRSIGVSAVIDVPREITKGNTSQTVYLTFETTKLLAELMKDGWYETNDEGKILRDQKLIVWRKSNGEPYKHQASAFTKKFKKRCMEVLGKPVTPHWIRHTAITHLVDNENMNIRDVQHYAGHSLLETTQIYVLVGESFSQRAFSKHSGISGL